MSCAVAQVRPTGVVRSHATGQPWPGLTGEPALELDLRRLAHGLVGDHEALALLVA